VKVGQATCITNNESNPNVTEVEWLARNFEIISRLAGCGNLHIMGYALMVLFTRDSSEANMAQSTHLSCPTISWAY
jgi:hypothetical protein